MESQASLWSTLHQITSIKRQELDKQREACRTLRKDLIGSLDDRSTSSKRVRLLLKDAGKTGKTKESAQHQEILDLAGISAANVQNFLEQAEYDDNISSQYFQTIEGKFKSALLTLEMKFDYAALFSDLVTEWSVQRSEAASDLVDGVAIGRKEMYEQRKQWEELVYSSSNIDKAKITGVLREVFGTPEATQSLNILRSSVETLCSKLQNDKINVAQMKTVVTGLLSSDLLSDEQSSSLKEVKNNSIWLSEMADVLNLRLNSIESWDWEVEAMPLEMRRQLNGKYRVFMQEEITQALLIYYVGIHFASSFARILDHFYHSDGWKKHPGVSRSDQAKWDYFVNAGPHHDSSSIRKGISRIYAEEYFMSLLPRHVDEGDGGYGDDALQEDVNVQSRVTKTVDAQQKLLHLLVTESLMADQLDEEMIVVQTDFKWFGPSLSHDTISAVLDFLGVTSVWQTFFQRFLSAPMRFLQDGPDGAIRRRQCGVPMSHVLSSFFGEATLFCLDFAVNEVTNGKPMFRMHDDIWMWGKAEDMINAWRTLTNLATTMGITINEEKTGSARLTRNSHLAAQAIPDQLPRGALHWGLLSVQREGRFTINQVKIENHIIELKRQLSTRQTSILNWIQAYNTYMKFFTHNLCKPANALGQLHVNESMSAIQRINREVCSSTGGNVALYIKGMIADRFNVKGSIIPDGFLFLPMTCGGLELRNPVISFQLRKGGVLKEPVSTLDEAKIGELVEYRRLKKVFDERGPANRDAMQDKPKEFMSIDDFATFRREYSLPYWQAWNKLMRTADEGMVEKTLEAPGWNVVESTLDADSAYWRSIVELYGPETREMFGGIQVVERGLLPMGMVNLCKTRVRWDS